MYKFIADSPADLSSGKLYVYKGSKDGTGMWILIDNTTIAERNSTLTQSDAVDATVFKGIEDVEIGPDGWIYFAVKNENRVYKFQDSDPISGTTVTKMETYAGNMIYNVAHENGTSAVDWGRGNDNLAFDGDGNLWVMQDGDENYIWVVENGHTQSSPKVKIFGRTPSGSEPTGITFSPDYRFLFMSIQHPNDTNNSTLQTDAAGNSIGFHKDISLVIALEDNLGTTLSNDEHGFKITPKIYPNPFKKIITMDFENVLSDVKISVYNHLGQRLIEKKYNSTDHVQVDLANFYSGLYVVNVFSEGKFLGNYKIVKD